MPAYVAEVKITKHHRLCWGTYLELALSLNLDKLNLKITNCKKAQNFFVVRKKASSLNHNLKDEDWVAGDLGGTAASAVAELWGDD